MTAIPGRRRRSSIIASVAAVGTIAAAAALATLGGVTLYHSTEGADAASGVPELVFPFTPTGALAGVDPSGALASVTVLVAQPSGAGGSVVTVPVNADSSNGKGDARLPLAETFALSGPGALEQELESMLALGIDVLEVADADRLTSLLGGLGDVPSIDPAATAAELSTVDADVASAEHYAATTQTWTATAAAMSDSGDGGAPLDPGAITVEGLLAALASGPVGVRGLRADPVDAELNPRGLDVSLLDQGEVALIFGEIAPGKVAAPNPALTLRIESRFSDEQLEGTGLTNEEVAYQAISSLLFVGANVLSVDTGKDEAEEVTTIEIAHGTLADATRGVDLLFGATDVQVAETRITGVDAVVRLGTAYLDQLADGAAEPASELAAGAAGG